MKKRIVSTLLAVCMVLILLPGDGLAEGSLSEGLIEIPNMTLSLIQPEPENPIIAGTTIAVNAHIDCEWLQFNFPASPDIVPSDNWSVQIDGKNANVTYLRETSPTSHNCRIEIVLPQALEAGQHTISFTAKKGVLYSHWSTDPEDGIPENGLTAELNIQTQSFVPKLLIETVYSSYGQNSNNSPTHGMRVVCENASFSKNSLDLASWDVTQPNDLEIVDVNQRRSDVVDTSSLVWLHFSRPFKKGEQITITVAPAAFEVDAGVINKPSGTCAILLDDWPSKPENISLEFTEEIPTGVTWTLPAGDAQPKSYRISVWENPSCETGQRLYCDEFDAASVDMSVAGQCRHRLKLEDASEMSWNPEAWDPEQTYLVEVTAQGTTSIPWQEINMQMYWEMGGTTPGEHIHTYTSVITPPTCTEKGYTTYTCECGETYRDNETPAAGHNYGQWVVVREATETRTGLRERSCVVCGDVQSETIPKLDPKPSEPVEKPSKPEKPAEKPAEPEKPSEPEEPVQPETPVQPQEPVVSVPVYDDVAPEAWYHEAAAYVASKGIMMGTSENNFSPDAQMTRAMIWTVLGRMDGADVSSTSGAWYAGAQAWSMEKGISDGANPNGSITRQELVTMLWRYMGSPAASADLTVFADSADVAGWAAGAVEWAVSSGIIQGSGNALNPGGTATRAEAAAILMRFCESTQ